jgi:oxaloacetate decarboxylase (Na+ extruding) subunit alpha
LSSALWHTALLSRERPPAGTIFQASKKSCKSSARWGCERYKEITDQVIQYALGFWGKEAPDLMDPDVKDKILSRSRAKEWERWAPSDPSLEEIRSRFGGPSISDDELLLRVYAGEEAVKALYTAGAPKEFLNGRQPLIRLIEALSRKKECSQIYIHRNGFSLALGKTANSARVAHEPVS